LIESAQLSVVLSLVSEPLEGWVEITEERSVLWLYALATAQNFRGRSLGRTAVKHAITWVEDKCPQDLYTTCECGSGFLVSFYHDLGFQKLAEEKQEFGEYGVYDMALLMRRLPKSV
jgi:GNAT superfamily N-acetyltransferase